MLEGVEVVGEGLPSRASVEPLYAARDGYEYAWICKLDRVIDADVERGGVADAVVQDTGRTEGVVDTQLKLRLRIGDQKPCDRTSYADRSQDRGHASIRAGDGYSVGCLRKVAAGLGIGKRGAARQHGGQRSHETDVPGSVSSQHGTSEWSICGDH